MEDELATLGMSSLFSDTADFTLINGKKNLRVSNILHKAQMQAYEKGADSAAIVGLEMILSSYRQAEGLVFKVNHPFVFFITKSSVESPELILFIGKVLHPTT